MMKVQVFEVGSTSIDAHTRDRMRRDCESLAARRRKAQTCKAQTCLDCRETAVVSVSWVSVSGEPIGPVLFCQDHVDLWWKRWKGTPTGDTVTFKDVW